jgi:deoxyribonuclease V
MTIHPLHSWNLTLPEAVELQRQMAGCVDDQLPLKHCKLVGAADVSHDLDSDQFFAGVVVMRLADGAIVERRHAVGTSTFPYHSGLLSFREAPVLLETLAEVETEPDVMMIDGHGYAHPRRFGLACHVGVCLDRPTLGCAKTRLVGNYDEPGCLCGDWTPLMLREEVIGRVVRTKPRVRPVFVSVGHRINLASAMRLALRSCRGYRLPEPLRQAHLYVNALRREANC